MVEVLLGLGSNIDREKNLRSALVALRKLFGVVDVSPVYESNAVGFHGDNFYNLVVAISTDLAVGKLSLLLKEIEDNNGRERLAPKFSARTLDIDILTHGTQLGVIDGVELPRDEILKHSFVLLPMADLRPDSYYPGSTHTYQSLWEGFDDNLRSLWQVNFKE
ncbi:2-amino-4-hydroxy-6-hydroxymethyldihydropteridine diphosphokinase [Teredinibacter franksiae]|uniref:2-amino-4-hydroxy-6- hydroxymethyldihydropteridine diphosphokinase n=1 Tax=Teredinibacter franksiae TaxID=2761453 RepID=UPI001628196A|nr:2-amino-4-hydroxy-6-hydroxymethyldihydropteridine diphosphokinase [Teredinibacter franksiae]